MKEFLFTMLIANFFLYGIVGASIVEDIESGTFECRESGEDFGLLGKIAIGFFGPAIFMLTVDGTGDLVDEYCKSKNIPKSLK